MRPKGGFSILELVITVAVVTIGVIPVVSVISTGFRADRGIEDQTISMYLAQEKLEEIKGQNWSDVASSSKAAMSSPFIFYSREVIVTGTTSKLTTVKVYWTDNGVERNVSLSTVLADHSP